MAQHSSNDDLQRSLGRVEGNQSAMESRMDRLEKMMNEGFERVMTKLDDIDVRTKEIENTEHQRKGAWKVIVPTVTILSSFVTWLIGRILG